MQTPNLANELAEIRAELARLHLREAHLQEALFRADGVPAPLRPGWPIRRVSGVADTALH